MITAKEVFVRLHSHFFSFENLIEANLTSQLKSCLELSKGNKRNFNSKQTEKDFDK